jgi:class 3 adenylate cyclase/CHASE3 domain sensor protein
MAHVEKEAQGHHAEDFLPFPRLFGPFVDFAARIRAGVHLKLLAGFFVGALLILAMGVLSLVVIYRMNDRVDNLTRQQQKVDTSRQAIYLVTAQSHFRAMALLTQDDTWNERITGAKASFVMDIDELDAISPPSDDAFFQTIREADERYAASGERVKGLYDSGQIDEAVAAHIGLAAGPEAGGPGEHDISHDLENALNAEISTSSAQQADAVAAFKDDRSLLTMLVGTFSVVSLISALVLGLILSWSFVRPVQRIDRALARIANGHFAERVEVPNRDEFGPLTENLNHMSSQLASAYDHLRSANQNLESLNQNLETQVASQVEELERANRLKRYLSPQVAEAIVERSVDVSVESRRRNLTVFFSDIRGFTELSEKMEPEELTDMLNEYLSAMTEIVFEYGGTLDKYIGDAIMVFFGDPIPYDDHAQRAVNMALAMRRRLGELQEAWFAKGEETLTIGMGVSTGYVTVGNIGSAARMDYTVVGNHVNAASRLAGQAAPGQILVTERTMIAVRSSVEAKEIGEVEIKGFQRPLRIYEVGESSADGERISE